VPYSIQYTKLINIKLHNMTVKINHVSRRFLKADNSTRLYLLTYHYTNTTHAESETAHVTWHYYQTVLYTKQTVQQKKIKGTFYSQQIISSPVSQWYKSITNMRHSKIGTQTRFWTAARSMVLKQTWNRQVNRDCQYPIVSDWLRCKLPIMWYLAH